MAEKPGASQVHSNAKTNQESDGTQHAKEMHGPIAKLRDEVDGEQVKVSTEETT